MASYSIGDESDDEYDFQRNGARGPYGGSATGGSRSAGRGGAALAPTSSRQPHDFVDPFDDDFATGGGMQGHPNASSTLDGSNRGVGAPRSYDDALIFDDFTGGKPANPLGTASDVNDSTNRGNFNRYDVYEE
jgi:hypothetical protein